MNRAVRPFLLVEAAMFAAAASVHFGLTLDGFQHQRAGTAESVIALVLLVGLGLTYAIPDRARTVALVVQGFALIGTLFGMYTVVAGFGPQSTLDLLFHVALLAVIVGGLIVAARAPTAAART